MIEVNRFINILNSVEGVYCIGDKSTEIFDLLFTNKDINAYQFERPDILIPRPDRTILLERFQFDGSESVNRSSSQKMEQAEVDRQFEKSMNESEIDVVKIKEHKYKNKSSLRDYESNLNRIFDKHASKYKSYIQNYQNSMNELLKHNIYHQNFDFGFIIEDASLLPNIMMTTKDYIKYLLTPFHFDSFKEKLKNNKNIMHLFFITSDGAGKYVVYYFYNHDIDDLADFKIDVQDHLIDFTPIHISGTIKIPNK
ncbi:MAG: hypothetical protein RBQ97_12465 [Acholeplasma sp.]|nr:hypothetical protein [Acholeplasma sp.]